MDIWAICKWCMDRQDMTHIKNDEYLCTKCKRITIITRSSKNERNSTNSR